MGWQDDLDKWKRDGFAILVALETQLSEKARQRDALTSEVERLRSEIAEVRKALPRGTPRTGEPSPACDVIPLLESISESAASRAVHVAPGASVNDAIQAVLAVADHNLSAKEVIEGVRSNGFSATSKEDVHRALYRLKKRGQIEVFGERPNCLYSLKSVNAEKQTALRIAAK